MSLRPRFGGDGRLRLPAEIDVVSERQDGWQPGDVVGTIGDSTCDPFERVATGLLLAEEFARVDLSGAQQAATWHARHGVLDVDHFFNLARMGVSARPISAGRFQDPAIDVLQQQENVRWHLLSLARLSDAAHRRAAEADDDGSDWDARWVQPALSDGSGLLWLGAETAYKRHITWSMAHSATPDSIIPSGVSLDEFGTWWRSARAAYEQVVRDDVPVVTLSPTSGVTFTILDRTLLEGSVEQRAVADGLGVDAGSLVELERRLMAPYLRRAGEYEVALAYAAGGWSADQAQPAAEGELVVKEQRRWSSLLAPIYVQLVEGLRRVTEGRRGAAFCRECGQPFLALDARRSSFCHDRHRFRYFQRERRRKLAGLGSGGSPPDAHPAAAQPPVEVDPWQLPHVANQLGRRRTK